MTASHLTLDALAGWIAGLPLDDGLDPATVLVVDLDVDGGDAGGPLHTGVSHVVIGRTEAEAPEDHPAAASCDVVLRHGDGALDAILATVEQHPVAATAAALLLRGAERRSVDEGLLAESAVYSALQAGPEFAAWRASRPARHGTDQGEAVRVARSGAELVITLTRPHVRNALNTAMRDGLAAAFGLAAADPGISQVQLRGEGEAFCAGGDLDEFGSFPDPASAHLVRLRQSAGRAIETVRDRVVAHLHGSCIGSGIELPAFAARVVAAPTTRISLPEVSLGLVPGAGGTVSLPRRIGRHRTARLVLTAETIDVNTALAWGLVDELDASDG